MIGLMTSVNEEMVGFLQEVVGKDIPVYNASALTTTPSEDTRLEYMITNFESTGRVYPSGDPSVDYELSSKSEYRCQLIIRAIGDMQFATEAMANISGGIQTFGILEQYVNDLYIKSGTLKVMYIPINKDGVIFTLAELVVDGYIALEYKKNVGYFTKVEDVKITIK